jgi:hypothetical protein
MEQPMRIIFSALLLLGSTGIAGAQEIVSAYTNLEADHHCSVFATAEEGDGDWADMVCSGYRGYPVVIYYADARESIFYGFPPARRSRPRGRASTLQFCRTPDRMAHREATAREDAFRHDPSLVRQRPDDAEVKTEVLVVEKVGQIMDREGCAVGYVVATGQSRCQR